MAEPPIEGWCPFVSCSSGWRLWWELLVSLSLSDQWQVNPAPLSLDFLIRESIPRQVDKKSRVPVKVLTWGPEDEKRE